MAGHRSAGARRALEEGVRISPKSISSATPATQSANTKAPTTSFFDVLSSTGTSAHSVQGVEHEAQQKGNARQGRSNSEDKKTSTEAIAENSAAIPVPIPQQAAPAAAQTANQNSDPTGATASVAAQDATDAAFANVRDLLQNLAAKANTDDSQKLAALQASDAQKQQNPEEDGSPVTADAALDASGNAATSPVAAQNANLPSNAAAVSHLKDMLGAAPKLDAQKPAATQTAGNLAAPAAPAKGNGTDDAGSDQSQQGDSSAQHSQQHIAAAVPTAQHTDGAMQSTAFASFVSNGSTSTAHDAPGTTAHSTAEIPMATKTVDFLASEPTTLPGINVARVLQSMNGSEMRVGMSTADLGDIAVRTTVSSQQMVAQISVSHADLGDTISNYIPAVQQKLDADFGLHATIEVNQGGMLFSGNQEQSQARDQRSGRSSSVNAVNGLDMDFTAAYPAARAGEAYRVDLQA